MNEADDKKEALRSFIDLGKQHITLAAGVIAVTATFIKQITENGRSDAPVEVLFVGWFSLFISIVFGLLLHGRGIALMAESNYDPDDSLLSRLGQIQQVSFLLGIALLLVFVGFSL
ncbi:MAG TPA: hypothetical protein VN960_06465 [Gaiellaceae bacterium]|nr:hypothetical protein [Gaiellaceae bacterium]